MNGESEAAFSSDQRFGEWVVAKAARRLETHEHDIDSLMNFEGASALGILEFAGLGMASNRRIVSFAARYLPPGSMFLKLVSGRTWPLRVEKKLLTVANTEMEPPFSKIMKSWTQNFVLNHQTSSVAENEASKPLQLFGFVRLSFKSKCLLLGWDHGFKVTLVGEVSKLSARWCWDTGDRDVGAWASPTKLLMVTLQSLVSLKSFDSYFTRKTWPTRAIFWFYLFPSRALAHFFFAKMAAQRWLVARQKWQFQSCVAHNVACLIKPPGLPGWHWGVFL